jgi:hypothetical protein
MSHLPHHYIDIHRQNCLMHIRTSHLGKSATPDDAAVAIQLLEGIKEGPNQPSLSEVQRQTKGLHLLLVYVVRDSKDHREATSLCLKSPRKTQEDHSIKTLQEDLIQNFRPDAEETYSLDLSPPSFEPFPLAPYTILSLKG